MVTETRKQIENKHNNNSSNIRASYHERQEISHEEYHRQLNAENERRQAELIAKGYLTPPLPLRDLATEIDKIKAEIKQMKGGD